MGQTTPAAGAGEPTLNEAGGTTAFELLRLSTSRLSNPLRYGSVKKGSERVELEGRTLTRERDYTIDYAAGTVYLKVPFRDGQSLRVSYRYDEKTGKAGEFGIGGAASTTGFNGWKFDLTGGTSAYVGLGFTERMADGSVLSSNVFGLTNNFSLGPGAKVKGLMMVGTRERSDSQNLMGGPDAKADVEEGNGRALIQSLDAKLMGGSVSAYYQDIDSRFGAFGAIRSAGYSQQQVDQLSKERGLKRSSLSFNKVGSKSFNASSGMHTVGDAQGSITRRSYGVEASGLSINAWSQKVDAGFRRFQDTGAQDWQQLQKERGLERSGLAGAYQGSGFKASYDSLKLMDDRGSGLYRRSFGFEATWAKFGFSDQRVDESFSRFGDLRGNEWNGGQLAQERGLSRQNLTLQIPKLAGGAFTGESTVVRSDDGTLESLNLDFTNKRLSIGHTSIGVDKEFNRLQSIGGPDIQKNMAAMVSMANPGAAPQGNDGGGFMQSAGLERTAWRLGYDIGRGAKAALQTLRIQGEKDDLNVTAASLAAKNFSIRWREQTTGDGFNEINRLMASEQAALGSQKGFSKTDLDVDLKLGGQRQLSLDQMMADDATGAASRLRWSLKDKGFQLDHISRSVDGGFVGLASLADPERDLMRTLAGFDMTETALKWQIRSGLSVEGHNYGASNSLTDADRDFQRFLVRWSPAKGSNIELFHFGQSQSRGLDQQLEQVLNRVTLNQNLGKAGNLTLVNETNKLDGSAAPAPSSQTNTLIYDVKLDKKTGLRTEQSKTTFENGEQQTTSSNTISTELNKRAGVSVTDTRINRDGDKPDETRRNYGFWYDFGKGIRLKYGYVRDMKDENNATLNSQTELTGGTIQDVKFDSVTYQRNTWDDKRDQHVGRVNIANAKPLDWGWLKEVRFHYSADTARDYGAWQRENRSFGFGASRGLWAFSFDYQSQINNGGDRAVDRTFTLTNDRTGKSNFVASMRYGIRTMPNDDGVMIRDYSITWKPVKSVSLQHAVVTNPLRQQNNVLLGTLAQPLRTNTWSLSYDRDPRFKAGLFWRENIDEQRRTMTREAGVDLRLFANNPSPLRFTYSLAQTEQNGDRRTAHKFGFNYNQRPGPNQTFNLLLENLNWEHGRPANMNLQNWNLRLDYSLRF